MCLLFSQAAQREMERKRREEQVRQRKAELMQVRNRLFEAVNSVKPKARRIVMEVETLVSTVAALSDRHLLVHFWCSVFFVCFLPLNEECCQCLRDLLVCVKGCICFYGRCCIA